jgi:hypothetical protein
MHLVVKITKVAFVKSKALTYLTFLGVSLLLSPNIFLASKPLYAATETRTYCTNIPINASVVNSPNIWSCNEGYNQNGGLCIKALPNDSSNVKGLSTRNTQIPSSVSILLFLAGSSLGLWYLTHNRAQKTLW